MDPQSQTQNPEQVQTSNISQTPHVVQQEQSVSPAPETKKSNEILIHIALILIILSGAGGFYLGSYVFPAKPSKTLIPAPSPISNPTPTLDPTANWKTYTNTIYAFQISYPEYLSIEEDFDKEEYYDNLINFSSGETLINIKAIYDIDIYENQEPKDVATREIMDSGFNYSVAPTIVNSYSAAITTVQGTSIKTTYTTKHPDKNIFIAISFYSFTDKETLDQILSRFKFLD